MYRQLYYVSMQIVATELWATSRSWHARTFFTRRNSQLNLVQPCRNQSPF